MRKLLQPLSIATVLFVVLVTGAASRVFNQPPADQPNITVWAWDRYEDLSFLEGCKASVAFYAGTIFLRDHETLFKPRLHSLKLPKVMKTTPVFRIESRYSKGQPAASTAGEVVNIIKQYQTAHRCKRIQLDFDAKESERQFFCSVLRLMRERLHPQTQIAVTALASWCLFDRWLDIGNSAPDEAIAMLFSMGNSRDEVLSLLKDHQLATGGRTKVSIGISANEGYTNRRLKELVLFAHPVNVYIFNSLPWTRERFKVVKEEVMSR